jgi:hypothetical protein
MAADLFLREVEVLRFEVRSRMGSLTLVPAALTHHPMTSVISPTFCGHNNAVRRQQHAVLNSRAYHIAYLETAALHSGGHKILPYCTSNGLQKPLQRTTATH